MKCHYVLYVPSTDSFVQNEPEALGSRWGSVPFTHQASSYDSYEEACKAKEEYNSYWGEKLKIDDINEDDNFRVLPMSAHLILTEYHPEITSELRLLKMREEIRALNRVIKKLEEM